MPKGISTFMAAILLIAFTIAVGGLISVWLTSFTTTSTGAVESASVNQTKCAGAYIKVDRVNATSGTSGKIIYSNPTNQQITNINMFSSDGTNITQISSTSLSPGVGAYANWTVGTNTSVIAKGLCLATIPIEGSCKSGDSCWRTS